jgi:hypothetical protein
MAADKHRLSMYFRIMFHMQEMHNAECECAFQTIAFNSSTTRRYKPCRPYAQTALSFKDVNTAIAVALFVKYIFLLPTRTTVFVNYIFLLLSSSSTLGTSPREFRPGTPDRGTGLIWGRLTVCTTYASLRDLRLAPPPTPS